MRYYKTAIGRAITLFFIFVLGVGLFIPSTHARTDEWEVEEEEYYTVFGPDNQPLFMKAARIYEEDEYISADNLAYKIETVDDSNHTARAILIGKEEMPDIGDILGDVENETDGELYGIVDDIDDAIGLGDSGEAQAAANKLIGLYCTHSDESYVPTDGISNTERSKGGIYDVANALKSELEKKGVTVMLDEATHFPHDAGAYRRSRQTATELLKSGPTALFDVHRDAIPADEYEKTINGKEVSRVRLLVGKSNQNMAVNKEFAKKIKAVADKKYPGMIKDIFIGKGNYNQELLPNSVLLEFGTHEINKERALESTKLMADVINTTLFGAATSASAGSGSGSANNAKSSQNKAPATTTSSGGGALTGIFWVLGIGGIAALVYAFAATGGKRMGTKLRRNASEMTGGLIPSEKDEEHDKNPRVD